MNRSQTTYYHYTTKIEKNKSTALKGENAADVNPIIWYHTRQKKSTKSMIKFINIITYFFNVIIANLNVKFIKSLSKRRGKTP